jgi:hypothetical protein
MSGQERLYVVNVRPKKTICGKCSLISIVILQRGEGGITLHCDIWENNYHTTLAGMNVSLYFIVTLQRGVNFTQDEPFAIMILWLRKTICGKCQAKKDYMW